jgi:signal transduction histidine kinase
VQSLVPLSGVVDRLRARAPWPRPTWRDLPPASPLGVARMEPSFVWLRWGALALAVVLGMADYDGPRFLLAGGVLLAYTLWWCPIGFDRTDARPNMALLLEVAVVVALVGATGFSSSPFLVSLGVATAVAGFAGGLRVVLGLAGLAVVLASVLLASYRPVTATGAQFAVELVLVGVVGGMCRYLVDDAQGVRVGLDARVKHLSKVNDLMFDLHLATMSEPTSLDLDGTARWALERLEEFFNPDVVAVVLRDPATGSWRLAADKGGVSAGPDRHFDLQGAMADAVEGSEPLVYDGIGHGLSYKSRWGLYCPLRIRGELLGALAVESYGFRQTGFEDRRQLGDLAGAVALAVDNARWLDRIHTLGVEEERSRLARELHDHVGQSVVYLGLEVDRLIELNEGRAVQSELRTLRRDLRELVQELRDALVDLRSDVSESHGVDAVLAAFVERVNARSAVTVTLATDAPNRLPLSVEREFSRVAKEAVANAERHARASKISVLWQCREDGALLEVSDDGLGMNGATPRGASGYGLIGMRERADSVQAKLEVRSRIGVGTVVKMQKEAS